MKVQFRSILFALVLPVAACGGGGETPSVGTNTEIPVKQPVTEDPTGPEIKVANPVEPKIVEIKVPTTYDDALAMGREMLAKGKYGDAKEALELAAKFDKKKAEPHIELARVYIALSEKGNAVASARKATKLAPLSSQAWNTMGRAELNAHKYEEAIEAFNKSVELNQDNAFAWNNLGYTELLLKRYEDAVEHLTEATTKSGATGYMFNNLGTALEHLDRLDDARLAFEAGGKLGSREAAASRKRLEGVDTIVIATSDDGGKGLDMVDESDITDEDDQMEMKGSGSTEEVEEDKTEVEENKTDVEGDGTDKGDEATTTEVDPMTREAR